MIVSPPSSGSPYKMLGQSSTEEDIENPRALSSMEGLYVLDEPILHLLGCELPHQLTARVPCVQV